MTIPSLPQQLAPHEIDTAFQQAITHHQSGQLQQAGELYQAILHVQPEHSEANHNLGMIAVQINQPAAGLPYFMAALDADPTRGQYWLNYIDALFQAGQLEDARHVLELARQQGLQGKEVEALALRLKEGKPNAEPADTEPQHVATENPPTSLPLQGDCPSHQEINTLVTLFSQGRYGEAATLAQQMTVRFPLHEFGWKALGAVLKQQGRGIDALAPMQKAAALSPRDVEAHYNLGVTLQELDRLEEAETSYRQALQISPDYAGAHCNLGIILQKKGRLIEAEESFRQALRINPDYAEAHNNLGTTLKEQGRLDEARGSYLKAIQSNPAFAEAHCNLGNTLQGLGRLDEAEACYRHGLQIRPDSAETHCNLGDTLKQQGRPTEAEACYRRALEIKPDLAEANYNLANTLHEREQLDEAAIFYRRVLQTKPDLAEAHGYLGIVLQELGQLADAETSYRRAIALKPDYARAHSNLGATLQLQGRLDEAEASYRRAIALKPDFAEANYNLGHLFQEQGRLSEAEACYQRALEINPDFAKAHSNRGIILHEQGQLANAEASQRRALAIKPDYVEAHNNLGTTLQLMGRLDEAEASYRRAIALKPDYARAYNNLLFCLAENETTDAETLFSAHRQFGEQFEAPFRDEPRTFANSRIPERCLEIGIVSGDFRDHAIAYFIEPVLAYLSRHPQLSLHAYSNHVIEDEVTQRIKQHFAHWHVIARLDDAALAEQIRTDRIDILIDLSGHTANNRLLTFARKVAPVQVSWMGYPGTTGLRAMDYYLTDHFFLPTEQLRGQFTEKIVSLPASVPFLPYKNSPLVNVLPALSKGHVTFGSFNRASKLSHKVITLWSKLLLALPDSRVILGGISQDENHDTLVKWFEREGIARNRLSFHTRCGMEAYLGLHHQVDICLDTFPYNGGTTTLHALWMGVPTLNLAGSTAAGRSGASILGNVGLEDFVAHDEAEFVRKGLFWTGNLAALSDIRSGLRERFSHSPMGQPAVVAAGAACALHIMWQRWCAGLQAESFETPLQDLESTIQEMGK